MGRAGDSGAEHGGRDDVHAAARLGLQLADAAAHHASSRFLIETRSENFIPSHSSRADVCRNASRCPVLTASAARAAVHGP